MNAYVIYHKSENDISICHAAFYEKDKTENQLYYYASSYIVNHGWNPYSLRIQCIDIKYFTVCFSKTWDEISNHYTFKDALAAYKEYEKDDKKQGNFEPGCYDLIAKDTEGGYLIYNSGEFRYLA